MSVATDLEKILKVEGLCGMLDADELAAYHRLFCFVEYAAQCVTDKELREWIDDLCQKVIDSPKARNYVQGYLDCAEALTTAPSMVMVPREALCFYATTPHRTKEPVYDEIVNHTVTELRRQTEQLKELRIAQQPSALSSDTE